MSDDMNPAETVVNAEPEAQTEKKTVKRRTKKVGAAGKRARKAVSKRSPRTAKKTAKKKAVAKASASTPVARKSKKKAATRKARAKRAVVPESTPVVAGERRRGRPVSVELLRSKLEKAQQLLRTEKERRRTLASKARNVVAEHVARNKAMRSELVATRRELNRVTAESKSTERAREQELDHDKAREAAVQKFLESWESEFGKKRSKPTGQRGRPRGRPRGRKSKA